MLITHHSLAQVLAQAEESGGIGVAEVATAVLLPVALAVFGRWLSIRWRDRNRATVVQSLSERRFGELSTLYCDRVPDCERVPPNHFRAFFKREHSARSVRDFVRRTQRGDKPVHLLLVARSAASLTGFIKAIYIPASRSLFIAYFVAAQGSKPEEYDSSRALLSLLFKACKKAHVRFAVFELCEHEDADSRAKARLFRHYALTYGLRVRRLAAVYLQPEICTFDAGDCERTDATLYIAGVMGDTLADRGMLSRDDYLRLVSSIYDHVYIASFKSAEPDLVERYRLFVDEVREQVATACSTRDVTAE